MEELSLDLIFQNNFSEILKVVVSKTPSYEFTLNLTEINQN